jgi:hypothetical protein
LASKRPKLTFAHNVVIGLALLTMLLGLGNLVRTAMALVYTEVLPDVPMTVSWTYLAAMGGFWGVTLLACGIMLLFFRPWSRWPVLIAVTLYQGQVWINHLLFDASDYAQITRPRDLALTLLLLAVMWGALNWPAVRKRFVEGGVGGGK